MAIMGTMMRNSSQVFKSIQQQLGKKYLVVLSVGRSGSAAVAENFGLLHEPDSYEVNIDNLQQRIRSGDCRGESSHFWRMRLNELQNLQEECVFYHLVRSSKDVIASLFTRNWYHKDKKCPEYKHVSIPVQNWEQLNQIEKLCWHWVYWNEQIERITSHMIFLESITNLIPHINKGFKPVKWKSEWNVVHNSICTSLRRKYGYK